MPHKKHGESQWSTVCDVHKCQMVAIADGVQSCPDDGCYHCMVYGCTRFIRATNTHWNREESRYTFPPKLELPWAPTK